MAGKNWQAGSKDPILARALLCLVAIAAPGDPAWAKSDTLAVSYISSLDPNVLWEVLIGSIVVCAFLVSIALWIHSALRRVKRSQMRRTAYISSALNSLSHGVVMTDPKNRVVYCNDRYLEIYGLERSDIRPGMNAEELLELHLRGGTLDCSIADFYTCAGRPEGLITALPDGR